MRKNNILEQDLTARGCVFLSIENCSYHGATFRVIMYSFFVRDIDVCMVLVFVGFFVVVLVLFLLFCCCCSVNLASGLSQDLTEYLGEGHGYNQVPKSVINQLGIITG